MKRHFQPVSADSRIAAGHLEPVHRRRQLLTGPEVCARLGICRMTLWRWVKSGRAPAPVPMNGSGHPRWRVDAIEDCERGLVGVGGWRHDHKVRRSA